MLITEVLLTEVAGSGDPGPRSSRPDWLSVVAYVRATDGDTQYVAGGASTLQPRVPSPWNYPAVAAALEETVRGMCGTELDPDSGEPLGRIRKLLGRFEEPFVTLRLTSSQRSALSSVSGAIEAVLLDLFARARGVSVAELSGARRPVPARSTSALQVRADASALTPKISAQHERVPVTRLTSRVRVDDDVAALLVAEAVNVRAGGSKPLWLECGGRYSAEDAQRLLAEVAAMLTGGRLSSTVYVEQPLPRSRQEEMAALTRLPAELLKGVPEGKTVPDLRIVLDESVTTPEELEYFAGHGTVTGVSVDLRRGLDAAVRIVERAVDANPDVTVALCGVGQATDLEARAVESAARVLPKLDLFLPGRTTAKLARNGADDIDRGWSQTAAGAAAGSPPSLPRVVAWMGRCAWERTAPIPDPWASAAAHNEFASFGTETLGKNSLDSYLLEREALRLGLRTVRFRSVDFHVEDQDGRSVGFHCTTGPSTSRYIGKVCGDKQVARNLMARAGVRVPAGRVFDPADWPGALAFAESLGWPVVVKPVSGHGGKGVTSNIHEEQDLKRAVSRLGRDGFGKIIVEKHIEGADYRFLVVGDRVVSVVKRTAGGVVGDGRSSIAELVLAKNAARLSNPHLRTRLLVIDDLALALLRDGGKTPDSVPEKGELVVLTTAGNISRGGDSIEVLDETHPSLLEMAVRAVAAVPGLDHAGVDLLAEDHRLPADEQSAGICELNSLPATTSHHYPAIGPPRNVSRALMEFYAGQHGLVTDPQPETMSVGIRISGMVRDVGYRQWFANLARQLGLSGRVGDSDQPDVVEAEVTGALDQVSALSLQAIFGPGTSRPELVETSVITARHTGRFEVVHG